MAAQNGKDLLIKVDLSGAGQFETMAGLRIIRICTSHHRSFVGYRSGISGARS